MMMKAQIHPPKSCFYDDQQEEQAPRVTVTASTIQKLDKCGTSKFLQKVLIGPSRALPNKVEW